MLALLSVLLGSGASTGTCSAGPLTVGDCASRVRKCCCRPVASRPACCCRAKSDSQVPISPSPAGTNREFHNIEWLPWADIELLRFAIKAPVLSTLQERRVLHATSTPSVQTLFCIWQT
jgi:hypothetical protein